MINKNYFAYLIISIICCSQSVSCQKYEISIYGKWDVVDYKPLMNVIAFSETEKELLQKEKKKCLAASIFIDKNRIYAEPKYSCNFIDCDTFSIKGDVKKLQAKEYEIGYSRIPRIDINQGFIDQRLLNILKHDEDFVIAFETNCPCDMGETTLKILYLSKSNIVLYNEAELIVLKK